MDPITLIGMGAGLGFTGAVLWHAKDLSFRVEEGHRAILVTFGAALREGTKLKTFPPGIHFKWPWQHAMDVSVREQNVELSGEKGQVVMAEDGTVLRLDASLRYQVEPEHVEHFLFGLARPSEHITGLFTCLLRNEIANLTTRSDELAAQPSDAIDEAAGAYGLIRRERQLLNTRIDEFARSRMGEGYGIRFGAVDLTDILPPEELADALNAVMQSRAEVEARRFRAESECQQRVLSAEQGVEIARLQAQSTEEEMNQLAKHLHTLKEQGTLARYVERRRKETMAESRTLYLNERALETKVSP